MKEQKTAEQVLEENNFFPSAIVATMNNVARERLFNAMQSYSDQQNEELRERVKELEGALTATLNVARAYDRSRFVDILDKAEKTLKK